MMTESAVTKKEPVATPTYRPCYDVTERDDALVVRADMPGVKAEQVDLQFHEGHLKIHARTEPRNYSGRPLWQEYGVGDYEWSLRLGDTIDVANIAAAYHDGVLTLTLPKQAKAQPRKIDVKAN